jgi:endoglucanase
MMPGDESNPNLNSSIMKIKSRSLAGVLLVIVATTTSAQLPRITVEGNHFVDADGKTMVFRGLCASDPDKLSKGGHWNQEYFATLKSWGANIVRFPVHPAGWRSQGRENYLKLLDQGVAWAAGQGMYVIIDWHSIGNLRTELFQQGYSPLYLTENQYDTTRKEMFEFWRLMANHYATNTTVAFFELFNEPSLIGDRAGTCTWTQWKEIMEETIGIIRANGGQAIPLVAGFDWAYDLTPVAKDPINAPGIAYVSHPYPMKRKQPWEAAWTADWGFVADKYPVFLTEIGFCAKDKRGAHIPVIGDESYGDAITSYCAARGISYTAWVFDAEWSPMLIEDWSFTPTRTGLYFKNALQHPPATPANPSK